MDTKPNKKPGERIAKVIARAGICSRRDAERLIADGRVSLEGEVLTSPAVTVTPDASILVDGKPLPAAEPARLWRYHKRRDMLTTARDPQGRRTIFDELSKSLPRLQPIGRLDINSEGLLLLTNDGELKRKLELPATGWLRRYRVRVYGRIDPKALKGLAQGITIDGITYGPIEAGFEQRPAANSWITMGLREGKNREVRRVCQHLGLTVNRLIRIAYGPFQLGNLAPGGIEEVPAKVLGEQLGLPREPRSRVGFAKPKPRKPAPGRRKAAANPDRTGKKASSRGDDGKSRASPDRVSGVYQGAAAAAKLAPGRRKPVGGGKAAATPGKTGKKASGRGDDSKSRAAPGRVSGASPGAPQGAAAKAARGRGKKVGQHAHRRRPT